MKKFLILLPLIITISCASVPSQEQMKSKTENYTLPAKIEDKNALVYIARPSKFGGLISFNVFLDDKESGSEMGRTMGGQYIYFFVTPGKHKILSKGENTAEIEINAEAGKAIFIKQNPTLGFIMTRNNLQFIDELEAKYHIKNCTRGSSIIRKKKVDSK